MVSQFSPADWTTFKWEGTANFTHYVTVVLLLTVFLAAELNPFYLKVESMGTILTNSFPLTTRLRLCYGWNLTILLSLEGWPAYSSALSQLLESYISTQVTPGKLATPPRPPKNNMLTVSTLCRRAVRMGQHVWLLIATIATELLAITKWSRGQFPEPLPKKVKYAWSLGATLLVLYPTIAVRIYDCSTSS